MKAESNFTLNSLIIGVDGQDRNIDIKKVISLVYIEDIKSASVQVFISLTDTAEGELSRLVGMEPVFLNFEDADKNNGFNGNLMVFDVQNREISNNQSKAVSYTHLTLPTIE